MNGAHGSFGLPPQTMMLFEMGYPEVLDSHSSR